VYLSEHTAQDLLLICQELHPMPTDMVEKMIRFNEEIRVKTMITRTIGREGSPWEFNLRDLFRWFGLLSRRNGLEASLEPVEFLRMVYLNRFRNPADRQAVQAIFEEVFGTTVPLIRPAPFFGPSDVQIGHSTMTRGSKTTVTTSLQHAHLDVAESVLKAVEMGWLVILAGDSGSGKRHLLQGISQRAGRALGEFAMHPGVDTSEILGSFEQQDMGRLAQVVNNEIAAAIRAVVDHRPQLALAASDALQIAFAKVSAAPDSGASAFSSICTDILSSLAPISAHEHLASAQSALAKLRDSGAHLSGFAWIDGLLVKALRDGGWFLISEANLCSASVLDRLNSLCENNGSLVLSEKGSATGQPEIIRPHAGFRLFMTYDPRYGELSRAMRNRGIELHVARSESAKAAVPAGLAIESSSDLAAAGLAATEATASCPADGLASTLRTALPLLNRIIASNDAYASTGRALQLVESALSAQGGKHGTHQHFGTQVGPLCLCYNVNTDQTDSGRRDQPLS
jgi:midasin